MRLIDADALEQTDRPIEKLMMFGGEYVYTQTEIDLAPTIDAVSVVRCKECIIPHNEWTGCPILNGTVTFPDFYCAVGKQKEGANNAFN